MGTSTLESKLIQKISLSEEVLFEVFLDIQKAHDALNWDICLEILATYGVGPRAHQLLWKY